MQQETSQCHIARTSLTCEHAPPKRLSNVVNILQCQLSEKAESIPQNWSVYLLFPLNIL